MIFGQKLQKSVVRCEKVPGHYWQSRFFLSYAGYAVSKNKRPCLPSLGQLKNLKNRNAKDAVIVLT